MIIHFLETIVMISY